MQDNEMGLNPETTRLMQGQNTQYPMEQPMLTASTPGMFAFWNPIWNWMSYYSPQLHISTMILVIIMALYIWGLGGASVWKRSWIIESGKPVVHYVRSAETVALRTIFRNGPRTILSRLTQSSTLLSTSPYWYLYNETRPDGDYTFKNNYVWESKMSGSLSLLSSTVKTEFCSNFTSYSVAHNVTVADPSGFNYVAFYAYIPSAYKSFLSALWAHYERRELYGFLHRDAETTFVSQLTNYCARPTSGFSIQWQRTHKNLSPVDYATMESIDNTWQGNTGRGLNITCNAEVHSNGTVVDAGDLENVYSANCRGITFNKPIIIGAGSSLTAGANTTVTLGGTTTIGTGGVVTVESGGTIAIGTGGKLLVGTFDVEKFIAQVNFFLHQGSFNGTHTFTYNPAA
jgi:hypothetical protein